MLNKVMPKQKPGKSVQEVGTPRDLLDAVIARFGVIKWDLAANEQNHVVPGWSGPGSDRQPDSLSGAWWALPDGLLWLNPPFANISRWAFQCSNPGSINKKQTVAMLVPASVGSEWFRQYVDGKALVLFLSPRLTFVGHDQPYPKDCMLCLFGESIKPGYECWRWK